MVSRQSLVVGAAESEKIVKVLITGSAGQLGTDLVASAKRSGLEVVATSHADLDITDRDQVARKFAQVAPAVVIHAAAWTAVDACESDPQKAIRINGDGTANVVNAARQVGARVIYISTDYVFDGTKSTPYIESDLPNPQSVYGASKLAGEQAVDLSLDAVVRISWVCGEHGNNMVKTILRLASTSPTLTFVDDQIGSPTFTSDLAPVLIDFATQSRAGIWHVTNQGATSWFGFAQDVLRAAELDPNRVKPIATADLRPQRPAKRPANSVLENAQMRQANMTLLDDYHTPLQRLVDRLAS
ncbi:MAG: dTDP-4-dehydrorhamnose reductase [Actinobacteria bacterium]|nr:dTDP-4-dehydrorhamnose reductase [Actinomycetota bacterium]NDA37525.1 dTDP-4-dehydrorhamnose reductase [Acidimicrobiia bacterium]HBQ51340.1 dTDP-4-dehydrorhamnose reductase [Acidimicrobium sp.]NDB26589.1 dTDP-4-dehydrorhamnose reductase [Actinomycetota bacterium]NDC90617.1 dTDP-4-dehydrorhamnose reductase [Acidimicrobiia bacterium]